MTKNLEQHGDRFADRVLAPEERAVMDTRQDAAQFLAGRFAAKEAVVKALRPFLKTKPALREIVILRESDGAPELRLPDALAAELDGVRCLLSISHEKNYAAAVAVFVEDACSDQA